jgi:hypothetical protein
MNSNFETASALGSEEPLQNRRPRRVLAGYFLLLLALCAVSRGINAQDTSNGEDQKIKRAFYSPKDRLQAMHASALFAPRAVSEADIMEGPKQNKNQFQLHFNDKVICDFKTPGSQMGGKTPKFGCQITRVESPDGKIQTAAPGMDEEVVKVKFGSDDNEVYAEVAATRLMWALGYYSDSWFAVRVECHNCPQNPVSGAGPTETRTFEPATIVRKFSWHKMTEAGKEEEGWSWKELDTDNGRPSYERDGLKLMGAFLQHSDNKPPQQRLVCHKVEIDNKTEPTVVTCDKSVMLVQDLGATFGSGGLFTSNDSAKMNLQNWSKKELWLKGGVDGAPKQCRAALRKSLTAHDGLNDPNISEEGRRFDAALMCQLSDRQIEDLFKVSRAAQMPEYHTSDGAFKPGVDESSVVANWVQAFKQKREELAKCRCEWKDKPENLTVIDNPMGLANVPNYCAAKPF